MEASAARWLAASSDPKGVAGLLRHSSDPKSARAAAQQFGALLMQTLMQQSDGSGIPMVEGAGAGVVNAMFAGTVGKVAMSGEKLGLADLLLRSIEQKQRQAEGVPAAAPPAAAAAPGGGLPLAAYWRAGGRRPPGAAAALALGMAAANTIGPLPLDARTRAALAAIAPGAPAPADAAAPTAAAGDVSDFIRQVGPLLREAGQQLGVSPRILLAQAALETGWGRSVVGNNLFGIKAGPSWSGASVAAATHEYENGRLVAIRDNFRAYPDYRASVEDFVSLVKNSSRYRSALGAGEDAGAYAQALLAGGWATDIDYVRKLQAVAGSRHATTAFLPAAAPAAAPPDAATVPL